jgi:hypothetical protein
MLIDIEKRPLVITLKVEGRPEEIVEVSVSNWSITMPSGGPMKSGTEVTIHIEGMVV